MKIDNKTVSNVTSDTQELGRTSPNSFPFSSDGERALQRLSTLGTGSIDVIASRRVVDLERPLWHHPKLVPGRVLPIYTVVASAQPSKKKSVTTAHTILPQPQVQTSAHAQASTAPVYTEVEHVKKAEEIESKDTNELSPNIDERRPGTGQENILSTPPFIGEGERAASVTGSSVDTNKMMHNHHPVTPSASHTDNTHIPGTKQDSIKSKARTFKYMSSALQMRRLGSSSSATGSTETFGDFSRQTLKNGSSIGADGDGAVEEVAVDAKELDISSALGVYERNQKNIKHQLSEASNKRLSQKRNRYETMMNQPSLNLEELRKMSWSGIEPELRPIAWKLLSGYLPANGARRTQALARKRAEYQGFIDQYYSTRHEKHNKALHHQIAIDLPRTNPGVVLFQQTGVHEILERLLYIWAIRHPASGYVQGINDLATPFFVVFLYSHTAPGTDVENLVISEVEQEALKEIEADTFWCLSKLLDGIQDNYTSSQPGIQRKVHRLEELIVRLDASLHDHLMRHDVQYIHFAFRWMNCMLMRDIPLRCTIRMWDAYLSETNGFASLHLYVCAAFLTKWSSHIRACDDFAAIVTFIQNPPTQDWGDKEIEELVAEAYVWKTMFQYKYS
eukprot:CFRG7662T1